MKKSKLNIRLSENRHEKLRQIANQKDKTMTSLIEDWIDSLVDN